MTYYKTEPLSKFEFWGGAVEFASRLTGNEFAMIEEFLSYTEDTLLEVEINDYFWFNPEDLCIGVNNYYDEKLMDYESIMEREARNV